MNAKEKVIINITEGAIREDQAKKLKKILEEKGYKVKVFIFERDEGEDNALDTDFVAYSGTRMQFCFAFEHAEVLF